MRLNSALPIVALSLALTAGALVSPAWCVNVGSSFTYQGSLIDNGQVPNAQYDFRFTLFDAPNGGTQLGLVTVNDLQVNNGIFSVDLDFQASAFGAGAVWLVVEIRAGASTGIFTALPRQRINPAPFTIGLSLPLQQQGAAATPMLALTNTSSGNGGEFVAGPTVDASLNYGLIGRTPDTRMNAAGVKGEATAASGQIIGVEGVATNSGIGTGLVGRGGATGVYGETTGDNGVGVRGVGNSTNGTGVVGIGLATGGYYVASNTDGNGVIAFGGALGGRFEGTSANGNGLEAHAHGSGVAVYAEHLNPGGAAIVAANNGSGITNPTLQLTNFQASQGMCLVANNSSTWGTAALENGGTGEVLSLTRSVAGNFIVANMGGDAKFYVDGNGMTHTKSLEIMGGMDLSERFDVEGVAELEPGTVVSIDGGGEGGLMVSNEPYDHRVAGIVSGAGGVNTGMLMGQHGNPASGAHPVALTGRVYCRVTADNGPIRPGDLLTTSSRPGYAMRASDRSRAPGAVLGKAMGSLESGEGLVLVLVGLQ